ncbi:MAG: hypothetical protein GY834_02630 [Bacteroidetes bacterium]|nr:hypothetical protein [Bacteroidota bacterium]
MKIIDHLKRQILRKRFLGAIKGWKMFYVGLLAASILLLLIGYLYWCNFAGESISQSLWKSVGALVIVLVILIVDIVSAQKNKLTSLQTLVFASSNRISVKTVADSLKYINSDFRYGYEIMDDTRVSDKPWAVDEYGQKSVELVEFSFWAWMGKKFPFHWQVEEQKTIGVNAFTGNSIDPQENAEKNPKRYRHNDIFKRIGSEESKHLRGLHHVYMPKSAKWSVTNDSNNYRKHTISTKNIDMTISFRHIDSGTVSNSRLAEKLIRFFPEPVWYSKDSWQTLTVQVKIGYKTKFPYNFSKDTENQVEWAEKIMREFKEQFDWMVVREDVEKALDEKIKIELEDMLQMQVEDTFGTSYQNIFDRKVYELVITKINESGFPVTAKIDGHTKGRYKIVLDVDSEANKLDRDLEAIVRPALVGNYENLKVEVDLSNKVATIKRKSQQEIRETMDEMRRQAEKLIKSHKKH